ncbi:MAG TPA: hypothetical protein VJ724_16050, partial [Tahibacter sp.]|nr:hypothetical protein [Tahibacter sp.]
DTGPAGPTGATGATGATGPTGPGLGPTVSATNPIQVFGASGTVANWTLAPSSGPGFDPSSGNYTAPQTGPYLITYGTQFVLSAAAQTVSLGAGVNPTVELRRTSPIPTTLATAKVGIMYVNVALLLNLRALIQGQVGTSAVVQLNAGDVVSVNYVANGLTSSVNLENSNLSIVYLGPTP